VDVIEVHLTLSREMFGPDVPASLTSGELRELVDGVRFIGRMATSPVDKDEAAGALGSTRAIFCKSVASRTALRVGQKLQLSDLTLKKPGHGIPAGQLPGLVGRIVCRDVPRGAFLAEADLEPVGVNQPATV